MRGNFSSSVDVVSMDGTWLVRVRERGIEAERKFDRAEHADSFAAGQRIRLGMLPSGRDIPQRAYLNATAPHAPLI
jgi:hypothetical protein